MAYSTLYRCWSEMTSLLTVSEALTGVFSATLVVWVLQKVRDGSIVHHLTQSTASTRVAHGQCTLAACLYQGSVMCTDTPKRPYCAFVDLTTNTLPGHICRIAYCRIGSPY